MTERVSERIWAAARAAFESRRVAHLVARIAELEASAERFADRVQELYAALKPFAEYAERIEKERPGWFNEHFRWVHSSSGAYDIPMLWFIAARKAWRKEGEQ